MINTRVKLILSAIIGTCIVMLLCIGITVTFSPHPQNVGTWVTPSAYGYPPSR